MYSTKRLKLTTGFRIFTSFISLILFLFSRVQGIYHDNAFIITMLLLANFIIIVAQREESSNIYSFLLWIVEVSGIVCILWFTGGIYSLYFWLIFNPMLMMVNKNTKIIVTQHVLFVIAIFSLAYFAPEIAYVNHKTQTLIGVIVIVLYSYIIGAIYREQYVSNQKLLSTTKKLTKLSQKYAILNDCIIEFVTVLERIALVEKYDTILEAFKDYVAIVFQNDGFFITLRQDDTEICFAGSAEENSLLQNIIAQLSNDSDAVQSIVLSEKQLFYFYIKYENQQHIIGCFTDSDEHNHEIAQRQLMFLRQLYQLALNKLNVYSLNSELLIKNEQNRIAEEIHDGVNQELFAISCQLYNIKEKAMRGLSEDELIGRIEQVYDMIKTTNRQLKDIVYRMSKAKTTHTTLMTELTQFMITKLPKIKMRCLLSSVIMAKAWRYLKSKKTSVALGLKT